MLFLLFLCSFTIDYFLYLLHTKIVSGMLHVLKMFTLVLIKEMV